MDWQKIVKACKANGYTGSDMDLAAVKAFVTENLDIQGEDGTPVDLDAAHSKATKAAKPKAKLVLTDDGDELAKLTAERDAFRDQARKAASATVRGVGGVEAPAVHAGTNAKKAYDHAAKSGRTAFADADSAEVFAATTRLAIAGQHSYAQKAADLNIAKKAQVEFDNTLGGYLVPTEFVSSLLYLTEPYGTARRIANVARMSREVQQLPRKTGIPTMNWESETQSGTPQNVTFDMVEVIARKLKAVVNSSNELLADAAVSVADAIATSLREGYDLAIDNAYFKGDGTSTYGGYVGLDNALPAGAYINGSGNWAAFTTGDFNKAMGSLQNIRGGDSIALVCSRQFYHQVLVRLDKATSQFKELMYGNFAADGQFLGMPVFFSQVLPTTTAASAKSCYIGDFQAASIIGERQDLAIMSSEHAAFANDAIQWRATARCGIAVHGDGRGSTFGPIVSLVATS